MNHKNSFFDFLNELVIKLNNYLFSYYQNSQAIKVKILDCVTIDELEKVCLSLDDNSRKIEIESIVTRRKSLSPEVINVFLSNLKLLMVDPAKFERVILKDSTKLNYNYNREIGKVEALDNKT
jgi:hypothetical protein